MNNNIKIKQVDMGDNSELIVDGTLDQYTGEYLGDAVGYPRGGDYTDLERKRGIYSFFHKLKVTKKVRREILVAFYPDTHGKHQLSNENLCIHASIYFKEFMKFADKYLKKAI